MFFAHVALLAGLSHAVHVTDNTQGREDPAAAEAATAKAEADKQATDAEVAKITSETEALKKKTEADVMRLQANRKAEDVTQGCALKEEAARIKAAGEANVEKMKKGFEVDKQFNDLDDVRAKQLAENLAKAQKDGKVKTDEQVAQNAVRKAEYVKGIAKMGADMEANDVDRRDKVEKTRQEFQAAKDLEDKGRSKEAYKDTQAEWKDTANRKQALRKDLIDAEGKDIRDAAKKEAKDTGKPLIGPAADELKPAA